MLYTPITLPVSKMLPAMTTFLTQLRFKENIKATDIVNDLIDSCRIGNVDFGKGITYTFDLDLQPVSDLSETSTAFTITKPAVGQETIIIDNYKKVPLSVSSLLTRDAVMNEDLLNTFLGYVYGLMEKSAQFYLFDAMNSTIQSWTPARASQTITIELKDTSELTGADLTNALTWNSNTIATTIRKTLNNMKLKSNKYTDVATYKGQDNANHNILTALSTEDLKITMNDKYYTDFLANSIASLYHSSTIADMIPTNNFVLIPEDGMTSANANTICWITDKDKFALADFYKTTLSITDPSTTYTNNFLHFAYGKGVFTYAAGVKIVATYV